MSKSQVFKHNSNLVLGVVKGYDFEQVEPFLVSLKDTGYKGDVCLLTSAITTKTYNALQACMKDALTEGGRSRLTLYPFWTFPGLKVPYKVKNKHLVFKKLFLYHLLEIYPINKAHSWLINTLTNLLVPLNHEEEYVVRANLSKTYFSITSTRNFLYYLYLYKYGKSYSNVLLTDVRDVLFQKDPFEFNFLNGLCCFFEDKAIKDCTYTSDWLRRAFGNQIISEIGNKDVLCAGTTLGSRSAIMSYLRLMIKHISQARSQAFGIDQAVHNYILHKGLINNIELCRNYHGPILTMNYSDVSELHLSNDSLLTNYDGSIINTLHQYDRCSNDVKDKILVTKKFMHKE